MRQWIRSAWSFLFKDTAAGWTAFFTLLLTFFTCKSVEVSRSTDDTARATQRAFVVYRGIQYGGKIQDPNSKKASAFQHFVIWENSGTTPANLVLAREMFV